MDFLLIDKNYYYGTIHVMICKVGILKLKDIYTK